MPGEPCDLLPLSTVDPLSALVSINANTKAGTSHPDVIMDGNMYTHWVADYDDLMRVDQKPRVVMTYSAPVTLTHYSIQSANAHPSEDPQSWFLECSSASGDWETVDARTGEMFDSRNQRHVYPIGDGDGTPVSCTRLALRIVGIRDATTQGGGTIQSTIGPSDTAGGGGDVDVTQVNSVTEEYSAQVQVSEVQFFRRVSSGTVVSLPTTAVSATITLDTDFDAIGSDVDAEGYQQFVSSFKADAATLLGVSRTQIVVNSVLAASVVVNFTVVPNEDGRSLTVVALSTAFSRPGVSLAGAITTSTITSAGVTVQEVTVRTSSAAGSGGAVRASDTEPLEEEKSIVGMVLFVVVFAAIVVGVACACQRISVKIPWQDGQQEGDDGEVAKITGGDKDCVDDMEEGLPPPPLPSTARIELGRCLRAREGTLNPAQVHRQFDELDVNHDGSLTKEDVQRFVTQALGYAPSADFLSGLFAAFDQDCNGTLSEDEFAKMLKILRTHAKEHEQQQAPPTNPVGEPEPGSIAGTDWIEVSDDEGTPYYYNTVTQASVWEQPAEVKAALDAANSLQQP